MRETAALEGSTESAQIQIDGSPDWLAIARSAYERSTDYMDITYRKQWGHNIANFRCAHPPGSKYYSDAYKHRSKLFRPKTRVAVQKNEAAFAVAMFSTDDVVSVGACDKGNEGATAAAELWNQVLNYRLRKTIPWFKIAIGAIQEAQNYGVVVSKQEWDYQIRVIADELVYGPDGMPQIDDVTGEPVIQPKVETVKNEPKIKLIEIENIRIDPAADWLDPINSSPYVIECMPMYIGDVLGYMDTFNPDTGEYFWKRYTTGEIAASRDSRKTERQLQREAQTKDRREPIQTVPEFNIVWVHRNFVRWQGKEYVYDTLGTDTLLSDPKPLNEECPQGRPFVLGLVNIEAHKVYTSGPNELAKDLQAIANDTQNQRLDNVKMVLNKRYIAMRNKNTDFAALKRNVPGGVVLTDADPNVAVRLMETPDVTSSAYLEQDRINADFDDITGTMSTGSVQTNRQLNETVGGMNLLSASANVTTEYMMRTFVETWCEPVLAQVLILEQAYETEEILNKFRDRENPVDGQYQVEASVNVGFGNTDPIKKVSRLLFGIESIAKVAPWVIGRLKMDEVTKEIFGAIGYRDGSRFIDQTEESFAPPEQQGDPMVEVRMQEIQINAEIAQMRLANELEIAYAKMASQEGITMAELKQRLGIELENIRTNRDIEGVKAMNIQNELAFKVTSGRQGI